MLDSLYENIGGKIKNWAKWIFIIEAIAAILAGFILAAEEDGAYILISIIGPLVAWVGSWLLYGFGELIETNSETRYYVAKILQTRTSSPNEDDAASATVLRKSAATQPATPKRTAAPDSGWVCICGRVNDFSVATCACGVTEFGASLMKERNDNVHAEIVNGEKVCPKCGTAQKADRKVCWSCGAKFDN